MRDGDFLGILRFGVLHLLKKLKQLSNAQLRVYWITQKIIASLGHSRLILTDMLVFGVRGKSQRFSRIVCEKENGPALSSLHHAAHLCGNTGCVTRKHLKWKTAKENDLDKDAHGTRQDGERNPNAKLSLEDVRAIRRLGKVASYRELAEKYDITPESMSNVLQYATWKNV